MPRLVKACVLSQAEPSLSKSQHTLEGLLLHIDPPACVVFDVFKLENFTYFPGNGKGEAILIPKLRPRLNVNAKAQVGLSSFGISPYY